MEPTYKQAKFWWDLMGAEKRKAVWWHKYGVEPPDITDQTKLIELFEGQPEWIFWFYSFTWAEMHSVCRRNGWPLGMDDIPGSDKIKEIWMKETGQNKITEEASEVSNKITDDYCSLEVSMLLKKHGFNVPCQFYYLDLENGHRLYGVLQEHKSPYTNGILVKEQHSQSFNAPSHSIAIKWLRHNFGELVSASCIPNSGWIARNGNINNVGEIQFNDRFDNEYLAIEAGLLASLRVITYNKNLKQ